MESIGVFFDRLYRQALITGQRRRTIVPVSQFQFQCACSTTSTLNNACHRRCHCDCQFPLLLVPSSGHSSCFTRSFSGNGDYVSSHIQGRARTGPETVPAGQQSAGACSSSGTVIQSTACQPPGKRRRQIQTTGYTHRDIGSRSTDAVQSRNRNRFRATRQRVGMQTGIRFAHLSRQASRLN
jgi:hypothetical protein